MSFKKFALAVLTGGLSLPFSINKTERKKRPNETENIERPTCQQGLAIPVLFGTLDIKNPNVVWFGDAKRVIHSSGDRRSPDTFAFGMNLILCVGNADLLLRVRCDEKELYSNSDSTETEIYLNKPTIFGGSGKGGGIDGYLYFETGLLSQVANSYIEAVTGLSLPANRGVTGIVLKELDFGESESLRPWDFRIQRILKGQNGVDQWYKEKASIGDLNSVEVVTYNDNFQSAQISQLDTSGGFLEFAFESGDWSTTQGPYGYIGGYSWTPPYTINTTWQRQADNGSLQYSTRLYLKKEIIIDNRHDLEIKGVYENACMLYLLPGASSNYTEGLALSNNTTEVNGANIETYKIFESQGVGSYPEYNDQQENFPSFKIVLSKSKYKPGTYTLFAIADDERRVYNDAVTYFYIEANKVPLQSMNPAHIIRECLYNSDWGLGYSVGEIDDASFTSCADTLYNENFGLCLLWDRQSPIEDFIDEILRHIDAELYVDRSTGKYVLKLIRGDYNESSLMELNESNIIKISNLKKSTFGELTNSIVVNYHDIVKGENGTVNIKNEALIQSQNAIIQKSFDYPGITNAAIATRTARRDLITNSTQLLSCSIYATNEALVLNRGDVFKFSFTDYGIGERVMRVSGISYGDGVSKAIKIDCVQDIFSFPDAVYDIENDDETEIIAALPTNIQYRKVFEMPYYLLLQLKGIQAVSYLLNATPDCGYLAVAGARPNRTDVNFDLWVSNTGSSYKYKNTGDFCPVGILNETITHTQTEFDVVLLSSVASIENDTLFFIDDELMQLVSMVDNGFSIWTLTVKRGCLDSIVSTHNSTATVLFFDGFLTEDPTQYVDSLSISAKLLTQTPNEQLTLGAATINQIYMDARALRPLPPGDLKINGEYFPATISGYLQLTWSHRNRLSDSISGFADSQTSENGVTYNVRIYDGSETLIKEQNGITDNYFNFFDEGALNENLRIEIESKRDNYTSLEMYNHSVTRVPIDAGFGLYFGQFFGVGN